MLGMSTTAGCGLARDWVSSLSRSWNRIRVARAAEIADIANTFVDPELLRRRYIEPDCQPTNPADYHEDEPGRAFRTPVGQWLNRFLDGPFLERDGRNVVFVLGDAGMGKTSLLVMLTFTHLLRFWPSKVDFHLLKLGSDTIAKMDTIADRRHAVLLLDALDEDELATGHIELRLLRLLDHAVSFRQVLITCRTQYFPNTSVGNTGKIALGGFECNVVYLAPLSDEQVEQYIRKAFPRRIGEILSAVSGGRVRSRRVPARSAVLPMRSLRMRPLLLAYVEDLVDAGVTNGSEYAVYRILIDRWLSREERKLRKDEVNRGLRKENLWKVCQAVADYLNKRRSRTLSVTELEDLAQDDPSVRVLTALDIGGRSLLNRKSDGSFRFAHYTIQEFFLARRIVGEGRGEDLVNFMATDQVTTFFISWYLESPRSRQAGLWRFLKLQRDFTIKLRFTDLDLGDVDLRGAQLGGIDFSRSNLEKANLNSACIRGTIFADAKLAEAELSGVDVESANFCRADLQRAVFCRANLTKANLTGAVLSGTDFTAANLTSALMKDVILGGARFDNALL